MVMIARHGINQNVIHGYVVPRYRVLNAVTFASGISL